LNLKLSFSFLIITLPLICISCDTTDPPNNKSLELKLEDVSCSEVWIELATTNLQLPAEIGLKQNNNVVKTITLIKSDTLLYINSLLPNTPYTFQAVNDGYRVSSNTINVTTLDTTSQNFSFEILEFGDGFESSYFNDVWIFSENNIWVCGYIYDPTFGRKNIMHWDGNNWEPLGIQFNSSGIDGVWAQDSSKIYFAAGFIIKYESGNFIEIDLSHLGFTNGQRIEKLWGSSENNIYGVGPWGTIVWYNGVQWTKIEFDTQWYFYEITGNKETGAAYAVAINQFDDGIVVKLENLTTSIIYQKSESEIKISSRTITELNNYLYAVGSDLQSTKICRLNSTGEIEILHHLSPFIGIKQSSAFDKNDIYYSGDEGIELRFVHYNGVQYKVFNLPQVDPDNRGGIHAIKDLAISVGFSNNKAFIIKIRR
jgi:hypothetical protein